MAYPQFQKKCFQMIVGQMGGEGGFFCLYAQTYLFAFKIEKQRDKMV